MFWLRRRTSTPNERVVTTLRDAALVGSQARAAGSVPATEIAELASPRFLPPSSGMPPRRALVVEDFRDLADLEAVTLRRMGYEVAIARDVDEALAHVGDDTLDLVLLDLRLGSADGLNLLSHIRRMHGSWPPVLVVSGMIGSEVHAYLATVDNVATLPKTDIARLSAAVRALCTRARVAATG